MGNAVWCPRQVVELIARFDPEDAFEGKNGRPDEQSILIEPFLCPGGTRHAQEELIPRDESERQRLAGLIVEACDLTKAMRDGSAWVGATARPWTICPALLPS